MAKPILFDDVSELLSQANTLIGAAELHGIQTGLFCGKQEDMGFDWLAILLTELEPEEDQQPVVIELLKKLYVAILKQLQGISFSFKLLLPEDQVELRTRTMALSDWCRGFLCGLGMAGVAESSVKGVTKEAIKDLSTIAHVEAEEESEAQEEAYAELVEYVRIAVHTIQLELHTKIRLMESTAVH